MKKRFNLKNLKYKLKLYTNTTWKRFLLIITSLILLNTVIFIVTGKNLIERSARALLYKAGIYTEEVKSVDISSKTWWNNEEDWNIIKSAKWTGTSTAQINFDVDTILKTSGKKKDVIFVLDTSSSMWGTKLEQVKKDATELTEYLLTDSDNRAALINFNSDAEILSNFTNDTNTIVEKINNLQEDPGTNYNAGLKLVDNIVEGYIPKENRNLIVLFLTDGYPYLDSPNQVATYHILKDKYPYMKIVGVQYEMGIDIIEDIKDISDEQFLANVSTLKNVLFEASIDYVLYENFEIIDYIDDDYFYLETVDDIDVSIGTVKLEDDNGVQKITWNLGKNTFRTGSNANMTINVKLKEQYKETEGFYPTNKKENIISKLPEEDEKNIVSNKTPVLKKDYKVIYDTNPPTGCNIKKITNEKHFVYETVMKRDDSLKCDGYTFKGWEIASENIEKINDDYFIMPDRDVIIRATWSSQSITKSMDGTVNEKITLYKVIQNEALSNRGFASLYTGAGANSYLNPVYYYKGPVTNNNVLFAGYCWKMVRTTETGGVKLLYNGIPSSNGTCDNTKEASQLAKTAAFNLNKNSIASVGYMYNKEYETLVKEMATLEGATYTGLQTYQTSISNDSNYYYSTEYTYNGSYYNLTKPQQLGKWSDVYNDVEGKGYYTCKKDNTYNCSYVYYVISGKSGRAIALVLQNGQTLADVDYDIKLGSSVIDNGNGTYTLSGDVKTYKKSDWYKNYEMYKNMYICSDYRSTTCNEMHYLTSTSLEQISYLKSSNKYKYANDVVYENGKYKLVDTSLSSVKTVWSYPSNTEAIGKNHYTCFNTTGECSSVYYISHVGSSLYYNYITLTDGKKVGDALNEMLWREDVNAKDSSIKQVIDEWYKDNMTSYTEYLEDTVYCNSRSIILNYGWNPNSSDTSGYIYFREYGQGNRNLTCPNKTDQFTVNKENGNGALTYPVGLLTASEIFLAYNDNPANNYYNYAISGSPYWLGTPGQYITANGNSSSAYGYNITTGGTLNTNYLSAINTERGVRPVISLKAGTEYFDGNGTVESPYKVNPIK